MKQQIIKTLKKLEHEYKVTILYACETGSRAWGFPSPDSDYDIRVIYKHPLDWYLSLSDKKDTIEQMLNNKEFDISGWDIKKSLQLLLKSNPPLLERIQSPVVYIRNDEFMEEFKTLAKPAYSRIATLHHYLSLAKKCFKELEGKKEYKLKKFFYGLRTSFACKWILVKETPPPIIFQDMVYELCQEESIVQRIEELIQLKSIKNEDYMHPKDEKAIVELMKKFIEEAESKAKSLPSNRVDRISYDSFFQKVIK